MQNYACDNNGNKMPPTPDMADPIAVSGQTVTTGTAGDDKTFTVIGGGIYAVTGIDTGVLLSCTGVTSTPANIEWVAPINKTIVMKVPEGSVTIYLEGTVSSKSVYLRRLS